MRFAAIVEYDGTHYLGFQRQKNGELPTIQAALEKAISKVANHTVSVVTAGRTDRGVHATGQVIHFDTDAKRETRAWLLGINNYLPRDICIQQIKPVPENFHARFSAIARSYRYLILNSKTRSALMQHRAALIYETLDTEKMHEAAQYFIGKKDFSALRAAGCQSKTPVREVYYCRVERINHQWIKIDISANAFLHHMVRNIAGILISVGALKKPVAWVEEVLKSGNRKNASITAPAQGLYFIKAYYPEKFNFF